MPKQRDLHLFDTVSLRNFALARRLDILLSQYPGSVATTPEVLREIAQGIAVGLAPLKSVQDLADQGAIKVVTLNPPERREHLTFCEDLGMGEASCLAAAISRKCVVVTDDHAARAFCASAHVRVIGTIGVLVAACRDRILASEEADRLLVEVIANDYYSPVSKVSDILS